MPAVPPSVPTCRVCGVPVPSDAPLGHCPKCLVKLGLFSADQPEADAPPAAVDANRRFADYVLGRQIGRGGMGVVYEAQHIQLHRPVALKVVLDSELASPVTLRRFTIEAEAAAKLDHPNIVPIYEVGEHGGHPFISMKLVQGESLRASMVRGDYQLKKPDASPAKTSLRDRQETIARLMATLAHAVHHAHQRGVLHRDLKPGNILMDQEGQPWLTDFGLAKITEPRPGEAASPALTVTGVVMGTPDYMSPEQADGGKTTTASDIYSLGAILYELLTGAPPFHGNTPMETLRLVLEQDPRRPRSENRVIDRDLETICLKCLEKTPAARYGTAKALADDLERWLRREPIRARSAGPLLRTGRWTKRNPIGTALIASLLAGLGVTLYLLDFANKARKVAEERRAVVIVQEQNKIEREWRETNNPAIRITSEVLSILGNYTQPEQLLETPRRLTFAVNITETPVELARSYVPFLKWLERELGHRLNVPVSFDLFLCREFAPAHRLFAEGLADFKRMGALSYVSVRNLNPRVDPLAREDAGKKGIIYVRRELYEQGVTNLANLAGHSFAFGDTNSTVTLMAKVHLVRAGISATNLSAYKFFEEFDFDVLKIYSQVQAAQGQTYELPVPRSSREAVRAVANRRFEAGAGRREDFHREKHRGLVELFSYEVPPDVYAACAGLDPALANAFRDSLVNLRDKNLLGNLPLQPITQFLPASDADYDDLRRAYTNAFRRFEGTLPAPEK